MPLTDEIRAYWDEDAATYDRSAQHRPRSAAVLAAWTAALDRVLPPAPSRVLDCGAGTGFLSRIAARLGHEVTALDLSGAMLAELSRCAAREGLSIQTVHGGAEEPPAGFDAVIERHLVWTLPDPARALSAWRSAAPTGRLVLFESMWGAADPLERARGAARARLRRWRRTPPDHHMPYPSHVRGALPLGTGTPVNALVDLVAEAGWERPRLERLRDVEWAESTQLPVIERLVGVTPRVMISAD